MSSRKQINIAEDLKVRLDILAEKSGCTVEEITDRALRQHVDDLEQDMTEAAELERRWQRYQDGAPTISGDDFRKKLHNLAVEASAKAAKMGM